MSKKSLKITLKYLINVFLYMKSSQKIFNFHALFAL